MSELDEILKSLPDALPVGAFVTDRRGRVVLWNRALETWIAPAKDVLGKPLAEVAPRFTEPMRSADLSAMMLVGALTRGEEGFVEAYPRRGPDGTVRLFDVRIGPLTDGEGNRIGALCLFLDVTASRRKAERDLRNARTSSLASLGASLAHEIRNPLNSIALNLQLLREGIQDLAGDRGEALVEESGAILEEIMTLNRVVEDLLRFARDPAPFLAEGDARDAVERALRLLAGEAQDRSVRFVRDLKSIGGVKLDEDMLSRAVYNIALNAIQAMPSGGELAVRTEARPHSALIEIADTGPGVPVERREKIFDLFFSGRAGGTGIGLPIAHRIVEGHGGHITVEDAPDGGALFQIHLPREEKDEDSR
ncbi:MAG: two-component system sensor histidine kinase NtrB [Planctomycetota bacterium]|jgi:PAS domain S-box-containing protein